MKAKSIIILLAVVLAFQSKGQTMYGVAVPDSIKKQCEKVIKNEIGDAAYSTNVKYIKGDAHTKEKVLSGYTLFYAFNFPDVKESHVIFTLSYKLDPKKSAVIKDIAFKNYTRLPSTIKSKGAKIISYEEAKKLAVSADTSLKRFENALYSELSTDYDEKQKDYYFVWYFYHLEPCRNCEAEMYTTHSVFINATSGKVLNSVKK